MHGERGSLEKAIAGALKSAISAHGPIDLGNIPSAAKRVIGSIKEWNRQQRAKTNTMNQVHVLFSCDCHHTRESMLLLGVYKDHGNLVEELDTALLECGKPPLGEEQCALLVRINQTQGYEGEGEFYVMTVPMDTIDEDSL